MDLTGHKFPNIVKLAVDKNVRLKFRDCKLHLTKMRPQKLYLVHLEYGRGYYGRFDLDGGLFTPSRETTEGQVKLMLDVETRGLDAIKEYGRLYGSCCVCGRELTDEESVNAGIGPICAGRFK